MKVWLLLLDLNLELITHLKTVGEKELKRKIFEKDVNVELAFKRLVLKDYELVNLENTDVEGAEGINDFIRLYENLQHKLRIYFNGLTDDNVKKEYVKRWLSHQEIFNAISNQKILNIKYYQPFLQIVLSQLSNLFLNAEANIGDILKVEIVGEAGGIWAIKKGIDGWVFSDEEDYTSLIYIDQQIAWLLFSGLIDVLYAKQYYQIHGDFVLASQFLKLRLN